MKNYTDVDQSKQLSKILKWKTADMTWVNIYDENHVLSDHRIDLIPFRFYQGIGVPCWSLAALLDILNYPQLSKDKLGSGKAGWMVSAYPNEHRYDSYWHDNPVDACYEMIIKLHELNLL